MSRNSGEEEALVTQGIGQLVNEGDVIANMFDDVESADSVQGS